MPAKSKAQQKAAGETKVSELQGASKEMYDEMSEAELEDYAATDREGLPDKKDG